MKLLNEKQPDLEVALKNFTKRLLAEQQRWAKIRLFAAAGLSIGDLLTDLLITSEYFSAGQGKYAYATLGSLLANLFFQLIVTSLQNKGKPWKRQLKEQAITLSLMRPAVDAWRVASDTAREEGDMFDALTEFTSNKIAELLAEATPGVLIQLSAILNSGSKTTNTARFSLIFSIVTAAATSAMLSWDWDVNESKRKERPLFYGYVPSDVKGKITTFFSLFCLSASNLSVRSFACILFFTKVGFQGVVTLLAIELSIYLVIKLLRQDFKYWLPLGGGLFENFASLIIRVYVKVITDWTAVVQLRHANEVGGAYFTFSLGLTIAMGAVAVALYEKSEIAVEESFVMVTMAIGCVGMVLSYALLIFSAKKQYRKTFITSMTSNKYIQEMFTKSEDDSDKFGIITTNRQKWEVSKEEKELAHYVRHNLTMSFSTRSTRSETTSRLG